MASRCLLVDSDRSDRTDGVTTDVGAVADELYGLPAGEFTAARDRLAADDQAERATGRSPRPIKKLRRPTATAWCANQLVRQRADEVAQLLDAGAALRRGPGRSGAATTSGA